MGPERMVTGNSAWDENKEQMVGRSRGRPSLLYFSSLSGLSPTQPTLMHGVGAHSDPILCVCCAREGRIRCPKESEVLWR